MKSTVNRSKPEILWFVYAMDDPRDSGRELQFIEHSKEDALEDVKTNRCDFCEMSFEYCKIKAYSTQSYLGIIEDSFKYKIASEENPYKTLYFKRDFTKGEWIELSDMEFRQEYYRCLFEKSKEEAKKIAIRMEYMFGPKWADGLDLNGDIYGVGKDIGQITVDDIEKK